MLGRTAIEIAVDNENIEIVEILLNQPNIKIGNALLHAIREGKVEMLRDSIDDFDDTATMKHNVPG